MSNQSHLPGQRIREMRNARQLSMKDLAENCNPPMDFSTVGRIEKNKGYTKDSLERFAQVLECDVSDFFLYEEIKDYTHLPDDARQDVSKYIRTLILAHKSQSDQTA